MRTNAGGDMAYTHAKAPTVGVPRSTFDRSRDLITTVDEGLLYPIFVDEMLPGDTMQMNAALFARMATPLHPIFHTLYVDTHFFFVPNRLLYEKWPNMLGEQANPGDSTDYLTPTITPPAGGWQNGTLYDYFGLPTLVEHEEVANFHGRAYNLIWNEWFRAQELQNSAPVDTGEGPDQPADYVLLPRGKRHDYFFSCLTAPQRGDAVALPLGDSAPLGGLSNVIGGAGAPTFTDGLNPAAQLFKGSGNTLVEHPGASGGSQNLSWGTPGLTVDLTQGIAPGFEPFADLSQAVGATINAIRLAFQTQKLLERDARGGTRLTEVIRSHFGVISPDFRLQRPEFLGGSSAPLSINPVAQTSNNTGQPAPQGNLAAFATAFDNRASFRYSATEHGVILGLASIRGPLVYQQGIDRMWSRRTRLDYYWPAFAHIGEKAVLSKEIYADGTAADDDVFGYQEAWAEYRYARNLVTGKMRSNDPQSLDTWNLALSFQSRPLLNDVSIVEAPPVDRVIAVPSEPHFLLNGSFNVKHSRPMPTYSVPGLIDHF